MIEPKIDDLLAAVDSKYSLVILAAKRAREINSYYSQLGEGRGEFVPPLVETAASRTSRCRSPSRRSPRARSTDRAHRGARPRIDVAALPSDAGSCSASRAASPRTRPAHLARLLVGAGADVRVVMTDARRRGSSAPTRSPRSPGNPCTPRCGRRPATVLHVQLAHETDVAVVAPATANVIAKLAARARRRPADLDAARGACPLVVAPAMHTGMWEHPATAANVATLAERGVRFVGPVDGPLAARRRGRRTAWPSPRRSSPPCERAVAPAGRPRRAARRRHRRPDARADRPGAVHRQPVERQDGRRGRGGGGARGAPTCAWCSGPARSPPPPGRATSCTSSTAEEMRDAVLAEAARRRRRGDGGRRRRLPPASGGRRQAEEGATARPSSMLVPTPDILRELGERDGRAQVLVGFAAETSDLEAAGAGKLEREGAST